jgi:bifunctional UDP-N-acetylglucosamine pyrophosphorylase/glucosamine-1-phosphate N-acetyltransferase
MDECGNVWEVLYMDVCAVVMAAGEGKRMKSAHAKVVHKVAGKPLILWVRDALDEAGAKEQVYIVGHKQEEVRQTLGEDVAFVLQEQQLGTGHAVLQASHFLEGRNGCTLVLCGDAPLVTAQTLRAAMDQFAEDKCAAVIITADAPDPTGYGRIVRDSAGEVQGIVEHCDADEKELAIQEINSGMYCFDTALLLSSLGKIGYRNTQNEYYLTDTIGILIQEGHRVTTYKTVFDETLGVNDRIQLQEAGSILNQRILLRHMLNGVTIIDPKTTWIDDSVQIGRDVIIRPGCTLIGKTTVGQASVIGPDTHLAEARIGNRVILNHVSISDSTVADHCEIGPYANIRSSSDIGSGCRVGNFVEIKNATLGEGTSVAHQCYIGDADVGVKVNFGSGCSIANYDGLSQARARIGNHAFIGSNSTLVSPVQIGENAYVAAGSTVTEDVTSYSLAIARSRQVNKSDWVRTRTRLRGRRVNP